MRPGLFGAGVAPRSSEVVVSRAHTQDGEEIGFFEAVRLPDLSTRQVTRVEPDCCYIIGMSVDGTTVSHTEISFGFHLTRIDGSNTAILRYQHELTETVGVSFGDVWIANGLPAAP